MTARLKHGESCPTPAPGPAAAPAPAPESTGPKGAEPAAVSGRQLWREAVACFRPYRGAVLLAVLATLAGSLLPLAPPLLVRGLIDDAIPAGQADHSARPLTPYIVGLVLLPLAAG